jgi:PAS domain S-box-containing protein
LEYDIAEQLEMRNKMRPIRIPHKGFNVTIKLQLLVLTVVILIIGVQTYLNITNAGRRAEADTKQALESLYSSFNEEVSILEKKAAALSLSFAHRPDVQRLFESGDRENLYALLEPVFRALNSEFDIVHLQFHEPNGQIFLRLHEPEQYGDYTFTYRHANAIAIISRQTVAGVEIDPNRLGIQAVSPMFYRGQFIGLVEIGLDYDQSFLENLKSRSKVDYKMWISHKRAQSANLTPSVGLPASPSPSLFYYASTNETQNSISREVYEAVLEDSESRVEFVSFEDRELAVLIAPMLSFGDRAIGILEISKSREDSLAVMKRDQRTTLIAAAILACTALILMFISTRVIALRPLMHLTSVAKRQWEGDLSARVELLPQDEFGQLGRTFNLLSETLDHTLKNQEATIAERTAQLKESEQRFRDLAELLPIIIIEADPEMNLLYINQYAYDLFGYSREEIEFGINCFDFIIPEDRKRAAENAAKRFSGQDIRMAEYTAVKKDGERFPVIFDSTPIKRNDQIIGLRGFIIDITERKNIENKIKNDLMEKKVLLQEIHHRVKNNLTVINSLVSLQADKITDTQHAISSFKEIRDRIFTMALVHENLYSSVNLSHIDIKSYIEDLSNELMSLYGDTHRLALSFEITEISLPIDKAVPCGLILNELITNALKHAFDDRANGKIKIRFTPDEDNYYTLSVSDNGKGIPDKDAVLRKETLGLTIVQTLSDQINGKLEMKSENGVTVTVTFPLQTGADTPA